MKRSALALVLALCVIVSVHAAIPASDDFNRDNETPLGGNWTQQIAAGDATFNLTGNAVYSQGGANATSNYWNADAFGNDQYSQATAQVDGAYYIAVMTRMQVGAQSGYYFMAAAGTYVIGFIVAGSATGLATCSGTPTDGDVMKLSSVGNVHTAKVNGSDPGGVPCAGTDGSNTFTSGQPGIYGYGGGGTVSLDDWSADNIAGGGGGGSVCGGLSLLGVGCF